MYLSSQAQGLINNDNLQIVNCKHDIYIRVRNKKNDEAKALTRLIPY